MVNMDRVDVTPCVVISGIAGRFPESENVAEFRENLFSKTDMITSLRRWNADELKIPSRIGQINMLEKFDAGFFGFHYRESESMEPFYRVLLEKIVEAVFDSGTSLKELEGRRVNVHLALLRLDGERQIISRTENENPLSAMGAFPSRMANRINYFFKANGVSARVDSGCSSTVYAINDLYHALRRNECDFAIVASAILIESPTTLLEFCKQGLISPEGSSRPFDEEANGYVKAEAACAAFLQKGQDARRIYAEIVNVKTNNDGFKEEGIMHPSISGQHAVQQELYVECGIDPTTVCFVETHGTGTKVGDPIEMKAIENTFLQNKRTTPLFIGSTKSNMGHAEPAAGLVSIIKVIIGLEAGSIPPNIGYNKTRQEIKALTDGRAVVVTERTPWPRKKNILVGVNSYALGGANSHLLLRSFDKNHSNAVIPTPPTHLVCVSGRTEKAILTLINDIVKYSNVDHMNLCNAAFRHEISGHRYRGYCLVSEHRALASDIAFAFEKQGPLCIIFGEFGSDWLNVCKSLMNIPLFAIAIDRIHCKLVQHGIKLLNAIRNGTDKHATEDVLGNYVLQLALADVLKEIQLKVDYANGKTLGLLAAAYLTDYLTLEEALKYIVLLNKSQNQPNQHHCNGINDSGKELGIFNGKLTAGCARLPAFGSAHPVLINKSYSTDPVRYLPNRLFDHDLGPTFMDILPDHCVVCELGTVSKINNTDIHMQQNNGNFCPNLLLDVLGRIYIKGFNFRVDKIYGGAEFPVCKGTPMISPSIKWEHSMKWPALDRDDKPSTLQRNFHISLQKEEWAFLSGYSVERRIILPAASYIFLVWTTVAEFNNKRLEEMNLEIENLRFIRATRIDQKLSTSLTIGIRKNDGYFEVTENETIVVTGYVHIKETTCININDARSDNNNYRITMNSDDIYKELRLRGAHYSGIFQSVKEYHPVDKSAIIKWQNNWVVLLDNIMQVKYLDSNYRNLIVLPTAAERIIINAPKHMKYMEHLGGNNNSLSVKLYPEISTVRCGGIEMTNFHTVLIPRNRSLDEAVLEEYVFVPNEVKLSVEESVRVNLQIIFENEPDMINFKAIELFGASNSEDMELLSRHLGAIKDQLRMKPDKFVLSTASIEVDNAKVKSGILKSQGHCELVIAADVLTNKELLQQCLETVQGKYILSREKTRLRSFHSDLDVLTVHELKTEILYLVRKKKVRRDVKAINVDDEITFSWLPDLQDAISRDQDAIVFVENNPRSGILGLYNCIMRETSGTKIKCVFLMDKAPKFVSSSEFYNTQLNKGFAINVYKNNQWGTFRHMPLNKNLIHTECYFLDTKTADQPRWIEKASISEAGNCNDNVIVQVHYGGINSNDGYDVEPAQNIDKKRITLKNTLGFEFSGETKSGERVAGISTEALSSCITTKRCLTMKIPDEWTLEDAATVPMAYVIALSALMLKSNPRSGQSIFIHFGASCVGQAAIRIALHNSLTVYTTTTNEEERHFLIKQFPELKETNVMDLREVTINQRILQSTKGRGVDYILNLSDNEDATTVLHCLAKGGHFMDTRVCDSLNMNSAGFEIFRPDIKYHKVLLHPLLAPPFTHMKHVMGLIHEGINKGFVKPLIRKVFAKGQIEEALRYAGTEGMMGKVLVCITEKASDRPASLAVDAHPRYCSTNKHSYIIVGGLGGLGIELSHWLVQRGARTLILNSRNGVRTGFQAGRIREWKTHGVNVVITKHNITTKKGCVDLIREANSHAPVIAIFNLAMVLQDAVLYNHTQESFGIPFAVKSKATKYLDEISRTECPQLKDFVVFSSACCGGHPGVSNYAMTNSSMERICEQRKADGLPALAIQWGVIGEAGYMANIQANSAEEQVVGGSKLQSLPSVFNALDIFLRQTHATVVSSIVVSNESKPGGNTASSMINRVAAILGYNDFSSVSINSTLTELGMDSMLVVELQNILKREYDITMSRKQLRNLTVKMLVTCKTQEEFQTALNV